MSSDSGTPQVATLVLAAGQGRRMGGSNKLMAEIEGRSLVRTVVDAALGSRASCVTVVIGHQGEAIETALRDLHLIVQHNPDYADGLSTSLRCGIAGLGPEIEAALVLLADMPFVTPAMLDRLIAAFEARPDRPIVVPTFAGKRGNPVLWPRRFFDKILAIEGDRGARHLIGAHADEIVEVEIGEAVTIDLDTPEALAGVGGKIAG